MSDETQPISQSLTGETLRTNPFERSAQLANEGRYLDSFTNWFHIPQAQRDEAVVVALKWLSTNSKSGLSDSLEDTDLSDQNKYVLKNLSLLYSTTGEKIFNPTGETIISIGELLNFKYPAIRGVKVIKFQRTGRESTTPSGEISLGFEQSIRSLAQVHNIVVDANLRGKFLDFSPAREIIKYNLTDDEVTLLMKRFLSHLKEAPERLDEDYNMQRDSILDPVKHLNIVTDPEIGKYFEDFAIPEDSPLGAAAYSDVFMGMSIQRLYAPQIEYFEKVFSSNPHYAQEGFVFESDIFGKIPASLLYFTLLRQLVHLDKFVGKADLSAQESARIKGRIANYLFSDQFMQRSLPYLLSEEAYPDDLLGLGIKGMDQIAAGKEYRLRDDLFFNMRVIAQGEEAKRDKAERFKEILEEADGFLRSKGDGEKADQLAQREVSGIKFADYLKTA